MQGQCSGLYFTSGPDFCLDSTTLGPQYHLRSCRPTQVSTSTHTPIPLQLTLVSTPHSQNHCHSLNPRCKILNAHHTQVLGCTSPPINGATCLVYLGDGRFHLESAMVANPDLTGPIFFCSKTELCCVPRKSKRWPCLRTANAQGSTQQAIPLFPYYRHGTTSPPYCCTPSSLIHGQQA
jgi:hypothetical protein